MENEFLNNLLQKSAEVDRKEPPTEAWQFIKDALHKKRKRRMLWLFLFPVMLLSIGTSIYWITNSKNDMNNNAKKSNDTKNDIAIISPNLIEKVNDNQQQQQKKETETIQNKNDEQANEKSSINKANQKLSASTSRLPKTFGNNKERVIALRTDELLSKVDKKENPRQKKVAKILSHQKKNKGNKIVDDNIIAKNKEVLNEVKMDSSSLVNIQDDATEKEKIVKEANAMNTAMHPNENMDTFHKQNNNIVSETKKETNNVAKINPAKPKSKWQPYGIVQYGRLIIGDKNPFDIGVQKSLFSTSGVVGGIANNIIYQPNYEKGKYLSLGILVKKHQAVKKIVPYFGTHLQFGQFKSNVYESLAVNIFDQNGLLNIDTTNPANSLFSVQKSTLDAKPLSINSRYLHLGFVAGVDFTVLYPKKKNKLIWQIELMPSINIAQSIQWFHTSSGRYFMDKQIDKQFNLAFSTALLWQWNWQGRAIAIGPYLSNNLVQFNKNINGLSNIYTHSVGLKMQMALKK